MLKAAGSYICWK